MIDRAEDWDGDAVLAARNQPADGEQGDGPSADSTAADSPAADHRPAEAARTDAAGTDAAGTDAVLSTPEQRAAAHGQYRDTVDHTYDVARADASQEAGSQDRLDSQGPQDPRDPQAPRPQDVSEEEATRDADAEPDAGPGDAEAPEAEEPGTRDADGKAGGAREPDAAADTDGRQAWAESLPGLRAEWEKHEREFPGRSRSAAGNQADGGWLGDGGRRLTPEQNTDASKACEDIRTEGKEVIQPAMERVEAADPGRRLAGLEHMLKGEDRLKEKIAERLRYNPDWTAEQALEEVSDAVRFTLEYGDDRYTDGVRTDVDRIKEEGFELIKLKNLWTKEQYKGINSQWRTSETGLRIEVQFHTPVGLEAKELTHKAYERLRSPATSADEEDRLEDYQRRVNEQVPFPPRVFEIEDYPPERRDG